MGKLLVNTPHEMKQKCLALPVLQKKDIKTQKQIQGVKHTDQF